MPKYLKKFETHSQYEAYINSQDAILPNVSYCVDNNDVHYNPWVETKLIGIFNVEDISEVTIILGDTNFVSEIEVDGVVQSEIVYEYQFDTLGEHIVKYTLADPTSIGYSAFNSCTSLTSVTIPNSVTSIGEFAFNSCTSLTSVTIPNSVTSIRSSAFSNCTDLTSVTIGNSVTSIGRYAFAYCEKLPSVTIPNSVTRIGDWGFYNNRTLTSITVKATIPLTLDENVFGDTNNCPIYVPSQSVDTYKTATNWSEYADRIFPIPT